MSDNLTSEEDLGNVKLTVDNQAILGAKHRPIAHKKGLGNVNMSVDHQAKLEDKPGSSQTTESTADHAKQYLEDLALFTGSFRDRMIKMNVDAAALDEALSSHLCLLDMCSRLISLSSITSAELEMFLLTNEIISEPTLEDIKANSDSQQEIENRLLRVMLNLSSPREMIHMAQLHENRSIYESLCFSFIDRLGDEKAWSTRTCNHLQALAPRMHTDMVACLSGISNQITDWNFGFGNVNSPVDDPTISQPKPSSSKTGRETGLGKVNASLDLQAKWEGNPGPSQTKRAKKIPSETKSIKIGKDGDEITVGGSFVIFEPGTFNDVETITVTARLDPDEWPPGREAVTSTLDICAKNLQKKATLRLHTWLVADNEYTAVDIMCYKKHIKKWELFTTSSIGDSGFIEFQSQHFSKWIALLRNAFSKTYRMRPIVSFKSRDFVLALVRDAPLEIEQLLKDLKDDYGHDLKTRKLKPITCKKVNKVECCIEAIPDHFQFLDSATCTHDMKSIIEDHVMSYFNCQLECNSDCPATSSQEIVPRTIRIALKVDGSVLRTPDCFSYERSQPGNKESTKDKNKEDKVIQNVGGDIHVGINFEKNDNSTKRDFSGAAIGTVNDGTLTNTAENCTTSINAQKK